MKTYYMHTLDGKPAVFVPGQGICFATFYGKANVLARSLRQIRKEQVESARLRAGRAFDPGFIHGYIRVATP